MMLPAFSPRKPSVVLLAALSLAGACTSAASQRPAASGPRTSAEALPAAPTHDYWVYVGAESADLMHRVRFGPGGTIVERTIPVGESPTEMEGPHGLQISRDAKYLHLTTGHGSPDGKYWRYVLGPDTLAGPGTFLGFFPASIDVTPDGLYAFAVNFNLHGAMVPSSVSVIYTPDNSEVARVETCTMPHGSRVDPTGMRHYSTCMMDDQIVEIDAATFEVRRRFSVAAGQEGPIDAAAWSEHAGHEMGPMPPVTCSPTWAQPSASGAKIYVACNKSNEILEIDRDAWTVSRRFATGIGPYNLAVTPDGRLLVASLKKGGGVQVFDLQSGRSVMEAKSSTTLTHGVAISPDSRYAFVSSEGVGAQPGKVDVYDLATFSRVGTVDVGQQAGGIAFWKMEAATERR
jgi:DNA-binding beta-propeller fold protein YncE